MNTFTSPLLNSAVEKPKHRISGTVNRADMRRGDYRWQQGSICGGGGGQREQRGEFRDGTVQS